MIQKSIPQYRRRFFDLLRCELVAEGIDLVLAYGQPEPSEAGRHDLARLDWATERRTILLPLGRRRLYWQSCLSLVPGSDLVIVEQASKLLVNYILIAGQMAGVTRLALWGHGRTEAATPPSALGEAMKGAVSRRAHWWFAYNERSARYVRELGFPAERITSVQNAIDTRALAAAGAALTKGDIAAVRARLGLEGENVGLYVGAMYREKRLPFLVAACELTRQQVPDFEMIFVGAGPDQRIVEEAAARNPWMRYLGPLFDEDKVPIFRAAKVVLNPGRVGLGFLDCCALETPMVTTSVSFHAPEVDYLEDGVNGVMLQVADAPIAFSSRVATLLSDTPTLESLRAGCRRTAATYSVENMVERFAAGVVAALR